MKKYLIVAALSITLISCTVTSLSLSSDSQESSTSSATTSSSTVDESSSSVSSETSGQSSTSSSVAPETTVENKWLVSLGILANTYAQTKPTIPSTLSTRGIIDMIHVQTLGTGNTVGVAFESRVRGNGGNFTFRLGILSGKFGAFQTVSESEHPTFGDRVFTALRNGLAGKDATYANIIQTYVEQGLNTQTADVTETLEEMMPSMNAMLDYYEANISA
jgi:hypothetical protein